MQTLYVRVFYSFFKFQIYKMFVVNILIKSLKCFYAVKKAADILDKQTVKSLFYSLN